MLTDPRRYNGVSFCIPYELIYFVSLFFIVLSFSSFSQAQDFNFDFHGDVGGLVGFPQMSAAGGQDAGVCNRDGQGACETSNSFLPFYLSTSGDELTPFFYETVTHEGDEYIHMIIGKPEDGFAVEMYIRGVDNGDSNNRSTWAADVSNGYNTSPGNSMLQTPGNGTANPERVAVRQVMGGSWDDVLRTWNCSGTEYCSEFLKDTLLTKPLIAQKVSMVDFLAEFEVDMRNIGHQLDMGVTGYDGADTAAPIVNKVALTSPSFLIAEDGIFDMSARHTYTPHPDDGTTYVSSGATGGRYAYTPSADVDTFGAKGTYTYFADSFDVDSVVWCDYFDDAQNQTGPSICD